MTAMLSAMPPRALLFGGPCLRTQRHVASSTVPQAINKQEFITAVKDNVKSSPAIGSLTNVEFEQVVMGVFKTITTKVAAGESVNITGFGKFERRERKARVGRNPQTQEKLELPATVTPGFTPGKTFKEAVKAKQ